MLSFKPAHGPSNDVQAASSNSQHRVFPPLQFPIWAEPHASNCNTTRVLLVITSIFSPLVFCFVFEKGFHVSKAGLSSSTSASISGVLWLPTRVTHHAQFMRCWDLNPGLHAHYAGTLPTKQHCLHLADCLNISFSFPRVCPGVLGLLSEKQQTRSEAALLCRNLEHFPTFLGLNSWVFQSLALCLFLL